MAAKMYYEKDADLKQLAGKTVAIIGVRPEEIEGSNRFCELILDRTVAHVGLSNKVAVLQDHLKGRYSEVDQLNGLVYARDLANRDIVFVTPDETLASSLNKFSYIDMEELPVVLSNDGSRKLLGIITRSELMKIYRKEMLKRVMIKH